MNSIYKRLEKIDDTKSLNEKWNVKNQQELKKLKEDVQQLDETNPLVREIEEYIHDNIFGWETIGFENDHIYVVFEEDSADEMYEVTEELNDEFRKKCDLEFEEENDTTLLITVTISDEIDEDIWAELVEEEIDYECRAKSAVLYQDGDGYTFEWVSQESMSQYDANEIAKLTNNYFVSKGKLGVKIEGECFCRSYPEDNYKVRFTVTENISEDDIEDATVYEYGIIDDSEYFEEEYTTDWNEALETFNKVAHRVQERLVDMDDEEYEDYYSDGVVVRMIKGKEGSDAFDWDTIREVTVFRDRIDNEEELEESLTEEKEYSDLGIIRDKWEMSEDDYGEINDDTIKIIRKYHSPDDIKCWYWKKDYSGDRPCYLVIETTAGDMIQFEEHGGSLFQIDE